MSVEMACECPDGFGLPHSHIYEQRRDVLAPLLPARHQMIQSGWVRLWVDWKAVARALLEPGVCQPVLTSTARSIVRGGETTWP